MFGFLPVPFTGVRDEKGGTAGSTSDGTGAAVVLGNAVSGNGVVVDSGRAGSTVLEGIFVGISVETIEDGGSVGSGSDVTLAVLLGTETGTGGPAFAPSPPSPVGEGAAGAAAVLRAASPLPVMAV